MRGSVGRIAACVRVVLGVWFSSAFIGMFLEERFPFLHPYIFWTFRIYLGAAVVSLISLMVIAPGSVNPLTYYSLSNDDEVADKRLVDFGNHWFGWYATIFLAAGRGTE
jgi:hypothetical protein